MAFPTKHKACSVLIAICYLSNKKYIRYPCGCSDALCTFFVEQTNIIKYRHMMTYLSFTCFPRILFHPNTPPTSQNNENKNTEKYLSCFSCYPPCFSFPLQKTSKKHQSLQGLDHRAVLADQQARKLVRHLLRELGR